MSNTINVILASKLSPTIHEKISMGISIVWSSKFPATKIIPKLIFSGPFLYGTLRGCLCDRKAFLFNLLLVAENSIVLCGCGCCVTTFSCNGLSYILGCW